MLETNPLFYLMLIIWGIIAIISRVLNYTYFRNLRPRMILLLGAFLVWGSFLFIPWIYLDFINYFHPTVEIVVEILPKILVNSLAEKFGVEWLGKLLELFLNLRALKGFLVAFVPTFNLWTRFFILFPLVPAFLGFLWSPIGAAFPGSRVSKIAGAVLVILAVVLSLGLLLSLPAIDALGVQGHFQWMLLITFLGVRIGIGPWLTLCGLFLITFGGLIELKSQPITNSVDTFESGGERW